MHGILSLSALHLAKLRPENQSLYLNLSVAHQDPGLSNFRDQLLQISPANSKAMFAFSSVVVAFAFGYAVTASAAGPSPELLHTPSLEELFRVFMLARGAHNIVQSVSESLRGSNFAPVFDFDETNVVMPDDVTRALGELDSLNLQCQMDGPPETLQAYQKAIDTLRSLSFTVYTGRPSLTLAAGWAIRLPSEFMDHLQTYQPLSLVVLAHYCVFLHAERDHWCLNQWGAAVMRDIWQLLDDSWRPHVQWAMTTIFESQ
ncbi:hypothetical protein FE257_006665 [Aspergillus nanangensis]|uniref:Uncharacterized protein n=1 Tax=Aspergillus nanangensis TaxID=2582783 RepID=A0AAD4CNV8_ASPNN|nr:hypothetical protein FE257_006665 [Aspergillus nanangensis]